MNMGDKTRSVTVRLTKEQYAFLQQSARAIEVTPSKLLRMVVNAAMSSSTAGAEAIKKAGASLEHSKADQHDQLEH